MTANFDLGPAASAVAALLDGVSDADLDRPTPCDYPVAALLDHFVLLTAAFTDTARKADGRTGSPPVPAAAHLDPQWRTVLPQQLDGLVAAWRQPSAWEGMGTAGGVTMPADVMAVVALDELVLHGWDLARATGQPFEPDPTSVEIVHGFTAQFGESGAEGLFGPTVPVAPDAPLFDRALGNAGRDPGWSR